jgi:hypothetical protein
MNKCFLPMLLFCVACCLGTGQAMASPTAARGPLVYVQPGFTDTVPATPAATKTYHYKVFKCVDGTYGYDIYTSSKKLIHQPIIPGQPGNKGFARENAAAKVAGLVISKLLQNIFPPTVSTAELKQLGVW